MRCTNPTTSEQGFTLIEILIYMALATVIIVVLTSFMVDVTKHAAIARNKKEIQDTTRFIMNRLAQDVRNAQAISIASASSLKVTPQTGPAVRYDLDPATSRLMYDSDDANPSNPLTPLTSNTVRVTLLTFQSLNASNPDEVTVSFAVSQKSDTVPTNSIQINTTLVRHGSLYQ